MSSARFRLTTRSGSGIGINIFNFNFNSSTSRNLQSNNHTRALSRASSHSSTHRIGTQHPPAPRKTLPASPRSRYNPPTPTRPFTTTMASRTSSSSSSKPEIPPLSKPSSSSSGTHSTDTVIRPSSSVILLSPTNQVLLLHRVAKSTSFASAHVFPGGNLSEFHEGDYFPLPPTSDQELHRDSEAYRLAAVRETFEESGILLARRKDGGEGSGMLELSEEELEEGRRKVFGDRIKFREWVEGRGGVVDVENLIPFTRWITPQNQRKRFTTQMYLYMLPLHNTSTAGESQTSSTVVVQTPTHDGGIEHTAAQFDSPSTWLAKASAGEIILYPPQFYLLTLISRFLPTKQSSNYDEQREKLVSFLRRVPTSLVPHPTSDIPWAEKVMSPEVVSFAKQGSYGNGRVILGLAKPGRELMESGRGGDVERVVLVDFRKEEVEEVKEEKTEGGEVVKKVVKTTVRVPRDLEVMERAEAMAMAAAPEKKKEKGSKL